MKRQDICFKYKGKRYITAQCLKLREYKKYFRRNIKMEKLVNEIIKKELRKFVRKQIKNFENNIK